MEVSLDGLLLSGENEYVLFFRTDEGPQSLTETAGKIENDPEFRKDCFGFFKYRLGRYQRYAKNPVLFGKFPLEIEEDYLQLKLLEPFVGELHRQPYSQLIPQYEEIIARTKEIRDGYLTGKVKALEYFEILT